VIRGKITDIRRRIWNAGIKLWWYRLYIRKDPDHKSLYMDLEAMLAMSQEEVENYQEDLCARREIAERRENEEFEKN
jgi:hypothetical protein